MRVLRVLILGLIPLLAACSTDKGLHNLTSQGEGPDEFMILPGKPLTQPKDYAALPTPTPGLGNITDQNPKAVAVVALGGSREAGEDTSGIGRSDGALVNYASRNGRPADIRQQLANEDAEFRRKKSRLTNIRIARTDLYNKVYKREALEEYAEWWRWRQAGARTPAVPPPNY